MIKSKYVINTKVSKTPKKLNSPTGKKTNYPYCAMISFTEKQRNFLSTTGIKPADYIRNLVDEQIAKIENSGQEVKTPEEIYLVNLEAISKDFDIPIKGNEEENDQVQDS